MPAAVDRVRCRHDEFFPIPGDAPGNRGLNEAVPQSIAGRISRFSREPRLANLNDIYKVAAMLLSIDSVQQEQDADGRRLAASGQALMRMRHPCSLLRGV